MLQNIKKSMRVDDECYGHPDEMESCGYQVREHGDAAPAFCQKYKDSAHRARQLWMKLFRSYGTHYVDQLVLGGKMIFSKYIDQQAVNKAKKDEEMEKRMPESWKKPKPPEPAQSQAEVTPPSEPEVGVSKEERDRAKRAAKKKREREKQKARKKV